MSKIQYIAVIECPITKHRAIFTFTSKKERENFLNESKKKGFNNETR